MDNLAHKLVWIWCE